jgi:hypothetical protein
MPQDVRLRAPIDCHRCRWQLKVDRFALSKVMRATQREKELRLAKKNPPCMGLGRKSVQLNDMLSH